MSYRSIFLISALFAVLSTTAGNTNAPGKVSGKGRLLRLYGYGLSAYTFNDSCELAASKKYGFKTVQKAGCVLRPGQAWRWDLHNKRVHRKLDKRNSPDWWDKYIAEASDCSRSKK